MTRLVAILCAFLTLAWAQSAAAAIGQSGSNIGTKYTTSGGPTNVITTGTDAPVGSLIVVPTGQHANSTITSVVDNAATPNCSGAYTADESVNLSVFRVADYYCDNTGFDLPIGGTITTTFSLSTGQMSAMAFLITGAATSSPVDSGAHGSVNGAAATDVCLLGTSSPCTTAFTVTPSQGGSTLLLACVFILAGATGDSYAEDTGDGWTAITPVAGSTSNILEHCAYKIVSSTSAVPWTPTWTNGRTYTAISTAFKAAAGGATTAPSLRSLMGVGN